MHRIIQHTGALALGTGTFVYLFHKRGLNYTVLAEASEENEPMTGTTYVCPPEDPPPGRALVPEKCVKEGPLVLQLEQVQVMFRHGARTPLHLIPNVPEADYDPQFVLREHYASLFPYERVSCTTGCPIEWSDYEHALTKKPLRGGATAGALSSYGKDQMYLLGLRLQACYRDRLNMCTFNPKELYVISSNIRRTVESARCVMAGFYGAEQLQDFVEYCEPIKIKISDENYNILIPDTHSCEVLKKCNHSAMLHPDFIPRMKRDREVVEEYIKTPRLRNIEGVEEAQHKFDLQLSCDEACGGPKNPVVEFNSHHQRCQRFPHLFPLLEARGKAIEKVERFWSNVIARHPDLCPIVTENDMKALIYLRKFEVEEFEGDFVSGYRFHFYFDPANPYFYNEHLCKEVYTKTSPCAAPSKSTKIVWKPNGCQNLFPCECPEEKSACKCPKTCGCPALCSCPKTCKCATAQPKRSPKTPCGCPAQPCPCEKKKNMTTPGSIFSWFMSPTIAGDDLVGTILKDELWINPIKYMKCKRRHRDLWDQKLNFVFGRDDVVARIAHGWFNPQQVKRYKGMIYSNAITLMYYAMTGQHEAERCHVTRLSGGPLLTEMIDQAEKHIKGDRKAPKMCLYSSHDSTMTALLETLGIWDDKWPRYGADVRLELFKEVGSKEYYVRILYNGKVQKIRCQDEYFVHWCEFKKSIKRFMIRCDEWKKVCCSDILERVAKDILKHDEGEIAATPEDETPAGM